MFHAEKSREYIAQTACRKRTLAQNRNRIPKFDTLKAPPQFPESVIRYFRDKECSNDLRCS